MATDSATRRMEALRDKLVSQLLSLLLVAGLAAPSLHAISHLAQEEPHTPHDAPVFDSEECVLCTLAAALCGVPSEAIAVSPVYAPEQMGASAPRLVFALLCAPADARAPPVSA